jgi:hypothetical protein
MHEMFDQIDLIEYFEQEGFESRYSEITKKQSEIYEMLKVDLPGASLC